MLPKKIPRVDTSNQRMLQNPAPRGRRPKGKIWDEWLGIWVPEDPYERGEFYLARDQSVRRQLLEERRKREIFEEKRRDEAERALAAAAEEAEKAQAAEARRAEEARIAIRLAPRRVADRIYNDTWAGKRLCDDNTRIYYFDVDGNLQLRDEEKTYKYEVKLFKKNGEKRCRKLQAFDQLSTPSTPVTMGIGIEAACREVRQRREAARMTKRANEVANAVKVAAVDDLSCGHSYVPPRG